MADLTLTQGYYAEVDDELWAWLNQFRWQADIQRDRVTGEIIKVYASRTIVRDGCKTKIYMHRVIAGAENGDVVDHIDGNGLTNTRQNLRVTDTRRNTQSRAGNRNGSSKYKGVGKEQINGYPFWQARIRVGGRTIKRRFARGPVGSEEEAARWYDEQALIHYGPFAFTNFPKEEYELGRVIQREEDEDDQTDLPF